MDQPALPADALAALRAQAPERRAPDKALAPSYRSEAFAEDLWVQAPAAASAPLRPGVLLLALAPLCCAVAGALLPPLLGA